MSFAEDHESRRAERCVVVYAAGIASRAPQALLYLSLSGQPLPATTIIQRLLYNDEAPHGRISREPRGNDVFILTWTIQLLPGI